MNNRWYISALVIVLALLGGSASKEQNRIPNQEIVLQFASDSVSNDDAQHTIATVKEQLQTLGIHDIQVTKNEDGELKIAYFSTSDIGSIKKILSEEIKLELTDTGIANHEIPFEIPTKDSSVAYNFDVYEIQNGQDSALHLSGKLALEHKTDNDRLSNSNPIANSKCFDYIVFELNTNIEYTFSNYAVIVIDYKSNKIPEVRAGPNLKGMIQFS